MFKNIGHNTPILYNLYRVTFRERIPFSILFAIYKSMNIKVSEYICKLVSNNKFPRNPDSFCEVLLQVLMSLPCHMAIVGLM